MKWILGCAVAGFLVSPSIGFAQDQFDNSQFQNSRFSRMDWSGETFGQLVRRTAKRPSRVTPQTASVTVAEARRLGLRTTRGKSAPSE